MGVRRAYSGQGSWSAKGHCSLGWISMGQEGWGKNEGYPSYPWKPTTKD